MSNKISRFEMLSGRARSVAKTGRLGIFRESRQEVSLAVIKTGADEDFTEDVKYYERSHSKEA